MTHKSGIVWLDTDMAVEDFKSIVSDSLYELYPIAGRFVIISASKALNKLNGL